jgi:hypothetical protein
MKIKLEQHEITSSAWNKISTHYTERLAGLRGRLENSAANWEETLKLRAQIQEIKELLALATPERAKATDAD